MPTTYRLDELARRVGGHVEGDASCPIRGVATLDRAGSEELSFLTNVKYRAAARTTRAAALLVGPDSGVEGKNLLVAGQPYLALARLLELFRPAERTPPGVSPDARLGEGVQLGRDVAIGPFAVVEDDVVLGDEVVVGAGCVLGRGSSVGAGSELRPHVVLYPETRIGAACLIHSGVVLGADGFGFATVDGTHHKIPQQGVVVVEDAVEIGANSTVDRGALGETVVGQGTKLDNLVMLAHGVSLGEGCLVAAQSGVAGSTRIGAGVTFAGQSGAAGHLEIADGTIVAAKSAVFGDIPDRAFVAGVPAVDHRVWKRAQALQRRLPEMQKEIRELKGRLTSLERAVSGSATEEDDR